jgi:fucose 4-O-acetylase-like acetyltransferase
MKWREFLNIQKSGSERNVNIDLMKGLAIILVIIGHVIIKIMPKFWKNPFSNIIYSFHMPLFFVVSGYLMFLTLRGSRLRWIRDKAFYLLIPHFLVNAAIYYLSPTNLTEFPPMLPSRSHPFLDGCTLLQCLTRANGFCGLC